VVVFCGFDCLEVPRLGGACNLPHVWGVVLSCRSGGLVVLTAQDGQVGGPPRFGVMGRPGHRPVFPEESYQTVQRS